MSQKDQYLSRAEFLMQRYDPLYPDFVEMWLAQAHPGMGGHAHRPIAYYAATQAYLMTQTGDAACGERALGTLSRLAGSLKAHPESRTDFFAGLLYARGLELLRDAGPEETLRDVEDMLADCCDAMVDARSGRQRANNQTIMIACQLAKAARLLPGRANAADWRARANELFALNCGDAAEHPTVYSTYTENASTYNFIWLFFMLQYAEENAADAAALPLVEEQSRNLLARVTAEGYPPFYGAAVQTGCWTMGVAALERAAALWSDGGFRWGAERLFGRLAEAQKPLLETRIGVNVRVEDGLLMDARGLAYAHEWADDAVPVAAPDQLPDAGGMQKVLRSGWRGDDALVLVSSQRGGVHGHHEMNAINWFSAAGGILLHGSGYRQPSAVHKNTALPIPGAYKDLREAVCTFADQEPGRECWFRRADLLAFRNEPELSHVRLHARHAAGLPDVDHTRDVVLLKKSICVVADTFRMPSPGAVTPVVLYHTHEIVGDSANEGAHRFITRIRGVRERYVPARDRLFPACGPEWKNPDSLRLTILFAECDLVHYWPEDRAFGTEWCIAAGAALELDADESATRFSVLVPYHEPDAPEVSAVVTTADKARCLKVEARGTRFLICIPEDPVSAGTQITVT